MTRQVATAQTQRYMQGIAVPAESVRPPEFFARTRRHITNEKTTSWGGFGGQDVVEVRKSDIVAGILIKLEGSLVITGSGVSTSFRWPYDLIRQVRFTANGQSNIINCSGLKLKAREVMRRGDINDRGVVQTIGGTARQQGTLSSACEVWGAGAGSAIAAGTYPVALEWWVPVAEDEVDLAGAIFAATSSTDLNLVIDWESVATLFTGYGGTAPTLTGTLQVQATKYSIPIGQDGEIVVPDLSVFHSFIQTRSTTTALGDNEYRLVGQGAGKTLLRLLYQHWNGAGAAAVPLAMSTANFGRQAWRYAGNETPDEFSDGLHLRMHNERTFGSDVGAYWGFGVHDFASDNAFRDVVDMGTTSELRLLSNVASGVSLSAGSAIEYVIEAIFKAGEGA